MAATNVNKKHGTNVLLSGKRILVPRKAKRLEALTGIRETDQAFLDGETGEGILDLARVWLLPVDPNAPCGMARGLL